MALVMISAATFFRCGSNVPMHPRRAPFLWMDTKTPAFSFISGVSEVGGAMIFLLPTYVSTVSLASATRGCISTSFEDYAGVTDHGVAVPGDIAAGLVFHQLGAAHPQFSGGGEEADHRAVSAHGNAQAFIPPGKLVLIQGQHGLHRFLILLFSDGVRLVMGHVPAGEDDRPAAQLPDSPGDIAA